MTIASKAAMRAEKHIRLMFPNWPMRRIKEGELSSIIDEETGLSGLVHAAQIIIDDAEAALMDEFGPGQSLQISVLMLMNLRIAMAKAKGGSP